MRSDYQFRDFKPSELALLQELVDELYYTDAGPGVSVPDVAVTYRTLKRKPDKGRLVAFERDGDVVGYAILIFFFSNEFGGDIVDIDEILVTESARGQGVGAAFFKWVKRAYKKAVGWSLQVRPGNRKGRRFYAAQGFQASTNLHLYNIFEWMEEEESGRILTSSKREGSRKQATQAVDKKVVRKNGSSRASAKARSSRAMAARSTGQKSKSAAKSHSAPVATRVRSLKTGKRSV